MRAAAGRSELDFFFQPSEADEGFSAVFLLLVQPVGLEFHCRSVCVLNLQTLTRAISLVFSFPVSLVTPSLPSFHIWL